MLACEDEGLRPRAGQSEETHVAPTNPDVTGNGDGPVITHVSVRFPRDKRRSLQRRMKSTDQRQRGKPKKTKIHCSYIESKTLDGVLG